MKAVVINSFGDPSVLREQEIEAPTPGPGEIRVRVRAAGVNPIETVIRSGAFGGPLPAVLGFEFAGEVDAVGEGVEDARVGDRVVGWPSGPTGAYAEQTLSTTWVPVPDGVSFETAAATLVAADTAARGLRELDVAPGETILVHGASGSVGSMATQLAVLNGVTVIGTSGPANLDHVRDLGATAIEYGPGLVDRVRAAAPNGVDAVLETAGKGGLEAAVELRGGPKRVLTVADGDAGTYDVPFSAGNEGNRNPGAVGDALAKIADGTLTVRVGQILPLADAAEAHRLVETKHTNGKIILVP